MKDESKIIESTLYPDRALVRRLVEMDVTDGTDKIVFSNLPPGVLRDSIRVSGKGDAAVRIGGVDIVDEFLEVPGNKDASALEKEIEKLEDELKRITADRELCQDEKKFLIQWETLSFSRFSHEFYYKKTGPAELSSQVALLKQNMDRIHGRLLELDVENKDFSKKISKLRRELEKIHSKSSRMTINCYITVEVEKPGTFSFYLSYVVLNAAWSPVYDARLFIDNNEIEISCYGQVSQSTGEAWEDVKLFLSTARPSVSASLPELSTWFIDFGYDGPVDTPATGAGFMMPAAAAPFGDSREKEAVVDKGLSVTFGIEDRQDLPPDGTEKKVLIARKRFPVQLDYRAYPRKTEYVFIQGAFDNVTDFPMLAGPVKVYHDQNYIGDSYLETVVPSETGKLSLGADESLKIKRELLKKFTQKKGVTGGYTRTVFRYRITAENYKKANTAVLIEENIPVSMNKELKVKVTDVTGTNEADEQGVLNWKVDIEPGLKKEINLEYYVEYPKEETITGLDV